MIPFIVLVPLAVAGGGLFGAAHERFRRKRLTAKPTQGAAVILSQSGAVEQDTQVMAGDDPVQIKLSERAAHIALGVSALGVLYFPPLGYPTLGLISLPIIGYSAYNWLRSRYPFERQWFKSPSTILAILALTGSLATGHWVLASLVLTVDLAARKWVASWTTGATMIEESGNDAEWYTKIIPSRFIQPARNALGIALQGERRWDWFPILLARVSLGLFFAISGFNKLFVAANWGHLVAAMVATGLPYPTFLSYFLASIQFVGGSLLTIGFLSTLWSIALAFAMIVAIVTVEIPFMIPPGLGPFVWLSWFLYMPQVMYVIMFIWLIIRGPGPHSVDAIIARKLGVDKDSDKDSETVSDKDSDKDSDKVLDKDSEIVSDKDSDKGFGLGGASWTPLLPS